MPSRRGRESGGKHTLACEEHKLTDAVGWLFFLQSTNDASCGSRSANLVMHTSWPIGYPETVNWLPLRLLRAWNHCQKRPLTCPGDRSVKTNPTSTMVDFQQMVNSPKTDWPNFDSTISQLIRKPINQCHGWTYSDRTILHLNKFQFNNEFNNEFNNSTKDARIFQGHTMESIGSAWRNG